MIQTINIKNLITEEELLIDKTGKNIEENENGTSEKLFILDSIDWDSPVISMETYRMPFQIGQELAGVKIGTRKPIITGYIVAYISDNILGMTWENYYKAQLLQIEETKSYMNKVLNVFEDVEIYAGGYKLKARPSSPPKYSVEEKQNNEVICYFVLEFECFEPMFYKEKNTTSASSNTYQTINNKGDVDVGFTVKITTSSTTNGIKLTNMKTGEFIGVNSSVVFGSVEYIEICTIKGKESIILYDSNGNSQNIISKILPGSTFFKLRRGSHDYFKGLIGNGTLSSVKMQFSYIEEYFNIEGM